MRHEETEPEPPYTGPFVVIRPVGIDWTVGIEPALPTGQGAARTYSSKHEAFGADRAKKSSRTDSI